MDFQGLQKVYFHNIKPINDEIKKELNQKPRWFLLDCNSARLRVRVIATCATDILCWTMGGALAGTLIGGGLGLWLGPNIGKTNCAKYGATVGGAAGAAIAVSRMEQKVDVYIEQSKEYVKWKNGLTQQQYTLFLNAFENYIGLERIENLQNIIDLIDPISLEIIRFPVLSPHRKRYEKESIERALDQTFNLIECARASGQNEAEVRQNVRMTDPLGFPLYSKEELVYDAEFARSIITILQSAVYSLRISPDEDPLLIEGLTKILEDYQSNHRQITDEIIGNLTIDLAREGASNTQIKQIVKTYKDSLKLG